MNSSIPEIMLAVGLTLVGGMAFGEGTVETLTQDENADAKRKAAMSAPEATWEAVLENNLGTFYLPRYKAAKLKGEETAWDYMEDNPKLPRILIIGDSISRGYTCPVRRILRGKVNVHRAPANCGSTAYALNRLDVWLGDGKWNLIIFNFGIHDRATLDKIYRTNLETIIQRLSATGAKLVWTRTTPVPEGANEYIEGFVDRVNTVADAVMKNRDIPAIDLHKIVLPVLVRYQLPENCHYKEEGYDFFGQHVAAAILKMLSDNP